MQRIGRKVKMCQCRSALLASNQKPVMNHSAFGLSYNATTQRSSGSKHQQPGNRLPTLAMKSFLDAWVHWREFPGLEKNRLLLPGALRTGGLRFLRVKDRGLRFACFATVSQKSNSFATRTPATHDRLKDFNASSFKPAFSFGRNPHSDFGKKESGAEESRTPDLCIANAALSQLSYRPNERIAHCKRR